MKVVLALTALAVAFVSVATAAPAPLTPFNATDGGLEKRQLSNLILEDESRGGRNSCSGTDYHCIFLQRGAALTSATGETRCRNYNRRGFGIRQCRVETRSKATVVCPRDSSSVSITFGRRHSSFRINNPSSGLYAIWSEQRRHGYVSVPNRRTSTAGADLYVRCEESYQTHFDDDRRNQGGRSFPDRNGDNRQHDSQYNRRELSDEDDGSDDFVARDIVENPAGDLSERDITQDPTILLSERDIEQDEALEE